MHCGLEGFFTVCRTQCVWLSAMGGQLVHGTQSFQTRFKPLRGLSGAGGVQRGKMPSFTLLGTLTATCYKTQTLSSIKFCGTHLAPTAALIRAKCPDNANVDLCCFQALCFGLEFIFNPGSLFWPPGANSIDVSNHNSHLMFWLFTMSAFSVQKWVYLCNYSLPSLRIVVCFHFLHKLLGTGCITASMMDTFNQPSFGDVH